MEMNWTTMLLKAMATMSAADQELILLNFVQMVHPLHNKLKKSYEPSTAR